MAEYIISVCVKNGNKKVVNMAKTEILLSTREKRIRIAWLGLLCINTIATWIGVIPLGSVLDSINELAMAVEVSIVGVVLYFCAYKGYGSIALGLSMFGTVTVILRELNTITDLRAMIFVLVYAGMQLVLSGLLMSINRQIRARIKQQREVCEES